MIVFIKAVWKDAKEQVTLKMIFRVIWTVLRESKRCVNTECLKSVIQHIFDV